MSDELSLKRLRSVIIARFPDLADATFTRLSTGWDAVAVDVDDRLIFRFPRDREGVESISREARLLDVIRPRLTMRTPKLELFHQPVFFSRHVKLPGEHLVREQYDLLAEDAKARLSAQMAQLFVELHALDPDEMVAAGATQAEPIPADEYLEHGFAILPDRLHDFARDLHAEWLAMGPDPLGRVYGYFDGHGWNMAFDHERQRLNGVYDFADSRIGNLHEEFSPTALLSPDLTLRILRDYGRLTGKKLQVRRVYVAVGMLLLGELSAVHADAGPGWRGERIKAVADWAELGRCTPW